MNISNPEVSIIVPIYKVEPYLNKCLDTILNQTFKEFELILVDDGSPDNCGKICDEYAEKDNRIKVIHKENGGVSSARNAGLDIAVGKFIWFIDPDDWVKDSMLESMVKTIVNDSSDIVVCNFYEVYDGKNIRPDYQENYIESVTNFNNTETLEQLYKVKAVFVLMWNKLFRRELFNNIRFKENVYYEDEFIIHELIYKSNKVTYIPEYLYYYNQREGSILHTKFNEKRLDKVEALRQRILFFKKNNEKVLKQKAEKHYVDVFIWSYYAAKKQIQGSDMYLQQMKRKFCNSILGILLNPLLSKKNKLMILVFAINSNVYGKIAKLV